MKKLFILSFAITASLLFVQCKKTETLVPQEEVVTTVKSLSSDLLTGTSWEVLSIVSEPNAVDLSWDIKYPKLMFNNGRLDMKLGRDFCTKEYLNTDNKLQVTTNANCAISNPSHNDLYNLFEGEFEIKFSVDNPDVLFIKSSNETVLQLRKINTLTTSANSSDLSVD